MENNGKSDINGLFRKVIPTLVVALIIGGATFWSSVNREIAVIKDDLRWSQTTYTNDKIEFKDDLRKLEKDIKFQLENVLKKEDRISQLLNEIMSKLKVIEHELQIGRKK